MSDETRSDDDAKAARHKATMQKQKARVDAAIEAADTERGVLLLLTGNGKGKTTAAMGVLFRAWGRDMKVVMLQFIKHSTANFGEQRAAQKIGVTVRAMGDGFTWRSQNLEQSADLARALWEDAKEVIASDEYNVVILDEFTYPIHYGWIPVGDVIEVLQNRPEMQHIVDIRRS